MRGTSFCVTDVFIQTSALELLEHACRREMDSRPAAVILYDDSASRLSPPADDGFMSVLQRRLADNGVTTAVLDGKNITVAVIGRIACVAYIDAGCCYRRSSVACLSVCWAHGWTLQKRQNRSRAALKWVVGSCVRKEPFRGSRFPPREGALLRGATLSSPPHAVKQRSNCPAAEAVGFHFESFQ